MSDNMSNSILKNLSKIVLNFELSTSPSLAVTRPQVTKWKRIIARNELWYKNSQVRGDILYLPKLEVRCNIIIQGNTNSVMLVHKRSLTTSMPHVKSKSTLK